MESQRIGFVGLGIMGAPMAANVLRVGFDVLVPRSLARTPSS
jgi:3-hydroxyisobutyrate dehydrogenase-like beta-hydroxyacid dehydrogenase